MKARRILLLLTAWLAFDLATPLPGAFEFEIQDSEIEHSLHAARESRAKRVAAATWSTPREPVETERASRPLASTALAIGPITGDARVRHVRPAHRPSSSRASSPEDH